MKDDQAWRVLLVDDDEDDYLLTWIMLSEAKGRKIEFEWAKNYLQGSEMIRSKRFDAILVDYDLGPTSGIAFIREHVSLDSQTPFILYTGRGSYDIDVEALEAGATLYLPKSEATPLQLERSIRYAIEHKRTEEALRISEERFSKSFRASPDGLAITRQTDGRIIEVNDSFEKTFGYRREETIGKTPLELGIYADLQDRQAALSRLGVSGSIRDFELQLRTKSGELRHVTISVEMIVVNDEPCYLTILRDITDQKRAGQALRESEERFRVALQYAPIMVFHYDQDMRYTWAFNTHPDFTPEMLIGKTDAELVPGELGRELTDFKHKVFETGRGARREVSIALSDGQHTFDLSAEPMRDAQGTIIGVTAAAMDITVRKQTEAALERERELLRRLFDRIPVMIAIYRPDTRVVQLNPAFEQLTGWTTEEASQVDFMEKCYPDPEYRQTVRAFMESLQEGWMDIDMTTRDGTILYSSWSNIRLSDDTQVGIGIDIRDRKRAEEVLKNAVQQFEMREPDLEEFARLNGGIAPENAG